MYFGNVRAKPMEIQKYIYYFMLFSLMYYLSISYYVYNCTTIYHHFNIDEILLKKSLLGVTAFILIYLYKYTMNIIVSFCNRFHE